MERNDIGFVRMVDGDQDTVGAGSASHQVRPPEVEAFRRADEEAPPTPKPDEIQAPSLAEAEWNHIQQVLSDHGGNITRAAEQLGIPRRTLQRKLKKLAP